MFDGALVVPALSHLAILAEVHGTRGIGAEGESAAVVAPGMRLTLRSETSIGFAVPIRINGDVPSWGLMAQLQHGWD